ncbi:MAG: DinB family protein [Aureliella sp.]
MDAREAIKKSINMAEQVAHAYLDDLSDADMMKRPHPQCNHINWQVGHLISSEHQMLSAHVPGGMPPLPDGFAAKYTRETAGSDDPSRFASKAELMEAYRTQRAAAVQALSKVGDADWQKESGFSYAPTLADLYALIGSHWLMHCGQWVIVRRELGKPVVI